MSKALWISLGTLAALAAGGAYWYLEMPKGANLLTANQAHPTAGTTGLELYSPPGSTYALSQVATPSYLGGGSAVLTNTGSGTEYEADIDTGPIPVPAMAGEIFMGEVYAMSSVSINALAVLWFNTPSGPISACGSGGICTLPGEGNAPFKAIGVNWTKLTVKGEAPAGATGVFMDLYAENLPPGASIYWDDASIRKIR